MTTRSGPLRPSLYGLTTHAAHRSLVGAEKLFEIIEDFRQITFIEPVRSILLHFRFGAERHAKTGRMNHRQIVRDLAGYSLGRSDLLRRAKIGRASCRERV